MVGAVLIFTSLRLSVERFPAETAILVAVGIGTVRWLQGSSLLEILTTLLLVWVIVMIFAYLGSSGYGHYAAPLWFEPEILYLYCAHCRTVISLFNRLTYSGEI